MKLMKALIQSYNKETGKAVLLACVPFLDLKDKAKFTFRKNPDDDPYSDKANDYQRKLNFQHVNDIIKYLRNVCLDPDPSPIFPTSMLIAFSDENFERHNSNEIINIEIPDGCYIVDGQHRLKAMIDLYNSVSSSFYDEDKKIKDFLDQYKFNCSLLINYDLWEQAKVFADVNFKQKKVSKSLYYDIYGQEYSDNPSDYKQNGIYLAHALVEFINGKPYSPLYHQIKMLGSGAGVVSQAFFVEALLRHITSPRGIWYFDPYRVSVDKSILAPMRVELITFLQVIKRELSEYWLKSDSILCKTTGIGALMRLMGYLHKVINDVDFLLKEYNDESFSEDYSKALTPYIRKIIPESESLFSSKQGIGRYSNTGGKGMEMALYKELLAIVSQEN